MTTATKPTLETCAELVRHAKTFTGLLRLLRVARKHGHKPAQIRAYLKNSR